MDRSLLEITKSNLSQITIADAAQVIRLLEARLGIGAGAVVGDSGEGVVAAILKRQSGPLTIFDVGANTGQYCRMLHGSLQGTVRSEFHCFEPSRTAFEHLSQQVAALDGVVVESLALSDREGEATLYSDRKGSELASLTRRRLEHFSIDHGNIRETVELSTLDAYCKQHRIDTIDLLKIDVEGHELDVLRGGEGLFRRGAIDMVQFEFGGCNIDTRTFFQDFFYFFAERGYSLSRILPGGNLLGLQRYDESLEKFRTANYLAMKPRAPA